MKFFLTLIGLLSFGTMGICADTLFLRIKNKETNKDLFAFNTLDSSLNYVLSIIKGNKKPIVIEIESSTNRINSTIELDERFAFSEEYPLIIRALKGNKVVFTGSINIPKARVKRVNEVTILSKVPAKAQSKLLELDLGEFKAHDIGHISSTGFRRPYKPTPVELIINDIPQTVSRFPNTEEILLGKVLDKTGKFVFKNPKLINWAKAPDAWISGNFTYGWADDQIPIQSIDPNENTLSTKEGTLFSFEGEKDYQKWHIFNLLEELDEPGEYYIDRQTGKLYFYPLVELSNILSIEISYLKTPLFSLKGCSHVNIQGITIENGRSIGVYFEEGKNNAVKNCTIRNMGEVGVSIGKGIFPFENYIHDGTGKAASYLIGSLYEHLYKNTTYDRNSGTNNGIEKCKIYNCGMGGVSLGGGNRKRLKEAKNFVKYCEIFDINRLAKTFKGAINVDGVGNIITNNNLHDLKQVAIYILGNNHTIKLNKITNACTNAEDMGAIYIGRDPSATGHIIKDNHLKNIINQNDKHRVTGIYLDDGMVGLEISKNIFENVGNSEFGAIFLHGGYHIKLLNNLFLNCKKAIGVSPWSDSIWNNYLNGDLIKSRIYEQVNITSSPYVKNYPTLIASLKSRNRISFVENNVLVNTPFLPTNSFRIKNNYLVKSNIKNLDSTYNYELLNIIIKEKKKFSPIKFNEIGIDNTLAGNNNSLD